jgi:hypothetical protein
LVAQNTPWGPPTVAAGGNILPFPVRDQARTDPSLEQVRLHAVALDRELQDLAQRDFSSAGEWARQAATPIVRTDCITDFLMTVTAAWPAVTADERRRQGYISDVRDEFQSALSDTARSLAQLGDPTIGPEERREVLRQLPWHRMRHRCILGRLHELIEEPKGRDPVGSLAIGLRRLPDQPLGSGITREWLHRASPAMRAVTCARARSAAGLEPLG